MLGIPSQDCDRSLDSGDSLMKAIIGIAIVCLGLLILTTVMATQPIPVNSGEGIYLKSGTNVNVSACGSFYLLEKDGAKYSGNEGAACPWKGALALPMGNFTLNSTSVVTFTATSSEYPVQKVLPSGTK